MKTLPIDRPTLDDPLYSQKNPHQIFLLIFCVATALPGVVFRASGSQTLDESLNGVTVELWALLLLVGSLLALAGEFWRGHTWTALVIERAGLALVGLAALIYACVLIVAAPEFTGVRYIVCVNFAYALSCFWRVGQISLRLRYIRNLIREVNARHAH